MFVLAERLKAMGREKCRNGSKLTLHRSRIARGPMQIATAA
jgi:hypothetical protein